MDFYNIKTLYRDSDTDKILAAYRDMEPDTVDEIGERTPLHLAASLADAAAIKFLLENGAEVNAKNAYGSFPLHDLAGIEDVRNFRPGGVTEEEVRKCADLLFDAGASAIRKNDDGTTALCEAARFARYEVIESAIAHGVKLTITDGDGNNPLHIACDWAAHPINYIDRGHSLTEEEQLAGYIRCIRALLDAGIDIDEKNDYGKTALDIAIESGIKEITALLSGDENFIKTGGMTLHQAIEKNDHNAVKSILETDTDLNEIAETGDFKGMTPLAVACYFLDLESVELLLAAGANPNFKNDDGKTCLTRLLTEGDCQGEPYGWRKEKNICKILLKMLSNAGMDINETINDNSDTGLLLSCKKATGTYHMDYSFASAFISSGCDINRSNLNGETPLMLVSRTEGMEDLQIMLLEKGADVNAVDKNGNTPLHYAAQNPSANSAKEMAEMLFDFDFKNTDAVNIDGKTALEIATDNDNEPLVKFILMNS